MFCRSCCSYASEAALSWLFFARSSACRGDSGEAGTATSWQVRGCLCELSPILARLLSCKKYIPPAFSKKIVGFSVPWVHAPITSRGCTRDWCQILPQNLKNNPDTIRSTPRYNTKHEAHLEACVLIGHELGVHLFFCCQLVARVVAWGAHGHTAAAHAAGQPSQYSKACGHAAAPG